MQHEQLRKIMEGISPNIQGILMSKKEKEKKKEEKVELSKKKCY
jgi:hypothetical protein